jgi:hypothetical protein
MTIESPHESLLAGQQETREWRTMNITPEPRRLAQKRGASNNVKAGEMT